VEEAPYSQSIAVRRECSPQGDYSFLMRVAAVAALESDSKFTLGAKPWHAPRPI